MVPSIHSMTHVDAIYIFCCNVCHHQEWARAWPKNQGVHTHIGPICEALDVAVKQCNQERALLSFTPPGEERTSSINHNQLEPSFMYTQLFKKALLDMQYDHKAVQDLVRYWRDTYAENLIPLDRIDSFGREYRPDKAIWWYTREAFIYQMLNRALRLLEADIIVSMGFFIHDLHRQIERLHKEQISKYGGKPFVVYRGQELSRNDFEKLKKNRGGLISFNTFLSSYAVTDIPLMYAEYVSECSNLVDVLFLITIDPNINSMPFACTDEESGFPGEQEILFAMHTVFRIDSTTTNDRVSEVRLTLTNDDDVELRNLTEEFEKEAQGATPSDRITRLLLRVSHVEKAEELYLTLLSQQPNEKDKGVYYQQMSLVKNQQGEYVKALSFYEKAMDIMQKALPDDHFYLRTVRESIQTVSKKLSTR